jgi:hypothetical protein
MLPAVVDVRPCITSTVGPRIAGVAIRVSPESRGLLAKETSPVHLQPYTAAGITQSGCAR